MNILILLLLSHLIGDFYFQPTSWIIDKESRKLASPWLYAHVFIHIGLILLFSFGMLWRQALVTGIAHLIIDGSKLSFQNDKNKRNWFFIDQCLHIIVTICIFMNTNNLLDLPIDYFFNINTWWIIIGTLFLAKPCSVITKVIITKWTPAQGDDESALENAGQYIGILERLLVYTFVLNNHWEAIGFLLAAKSIFRFGNLKDAQDRKLTEYVLIGTLLSFGIALVVGMFLSKIISV